MEAEPARDVTSESTLAADWLGACRRATEVTRDVLRSSPTTVDRAQETGTRGEGGDNTLLIDRAAEDAIFTELAALHAAGARFTAVSEERGTVEFTGPDPPDWQTPGNATPARRSPGGSVLVVIDPIDGSVNAKRGLPHHALSLAVATGPTMADVVFGFVHDFGPEEEWVARAGEGATLDGVLLDRTLTERWSPEGKLEVLGIESADPRWIRDAADDLADAAYRVRALGTIAVTLCQVAAARLDAMLTIKGCRAVDAAAAQLIVREAGGQVAFTGFDPPLSAPLDLEPHSPIIAARTAAGLDAVRAIPKL